jgi:hypothetical protein
MNINYPFINSYGNALLYDEKKISESGVTPPMISGSSFVVVNMMVTGGLHDR